MFFIETLTEHSLYKSRWTNTNITSFIREEAQVQGFQSSILAPNAAVTSQKASGCA